MRGLLSAAIATLAVVTVHAFDFPETQSTVSQFTLIKDRFIVEFDSAAHYDALGKRAASPHEAVYNELKARSIHFDVSIEYDCSLFIGASMTLSADDLAELATISGVINILPVHEIYKPAFPSWSSEWTFDSTYVDELLGGAADDSTLPDCSTVAASSSTVFSASSTVVSASSTVVSASSSAVLSASSSVANSSAVTSPTSSGAGYASGSATASSTAESYVSSTSSSTSSAATASSSFATFPTSNRWSGFSTNGAIQVDRLHAAGIKGKGVKIAVVDGGTYYTHPALGGCFGTGCKISKGYDFVGDGYLGGDDVPQPDDDPFDNCYPHGTMVAGVIGANDNIYNLTGVAPEAEIFNYRIFSCNGKSATDIVLQAALRAHTDGADIINLSIGENSGWSDSALSLVGTRLVNEGVIVVAAASNRGEVGGFFAYGPASGHGVISAGGTTRPSFPAHQAVVSSGYGPVSYASFRPFSWGQIPVTPRQYYPIAAYTTNSSVVGDGCSSKSNVSFAGKIAIVRRGTCAIEDKSIYAHAAGAAGILVVNYADSQPILLDLEKQNYGMISYEDGNYLLDQIAAGADVKLAFDWSPVVIPNVWDANTTVYFSQYGPTNDLFSNVHVLAPAASIILVAPDNSSLAMHNYTVYDGTSFSSPMTAGAAALYVQVHGQTAPHTIKEAFMNTAKPLANTLTDATLESVAHQGAGNLRAWDAIYSDVIISPPELLLNDTEHFDGTQSLVVKNTGKGTTQYTIKHIPAGTALTFATSGYNEGLPNAYPVPLVNTSGDFDTWRSSFSLGQGQQTQLFFQFSPPSGLDTNNFPVYSGYIEISGGGKTYQVPYLGLAAKSKSMPIIDTTSAILGLTTPIIFNSSSKVQHTTTTYSFTTEDYPTIIYRLNGGTRSLVIDIVNANVSLGFTPNYNTRRSAIPEPMPSSEFVEREMSPMKRALRSAPSHTGLHEAEKRNLLDWWCALTDNKGWGCPTNSGGSQSSFDAVPILGRIYSDTLLPRNNVDTDNVGGLYNSLALKNATYSNGTAIPTGGPYRFLLRALKQTGDPAKEEDYESWLSQPFIVA